MFYKRVLKLKLKLQDMFENITGFISMCDW